MSLGPNTAGYPGSWGERLRGVSTPASRQSQPRDQNQAERLPLTSITSVPSIIQYRKFLFTHLSPFLDYELFEGRMVLCALVYPAWLAH